MSQSKAILNYVYDPMCSWTWGFTPTWNEIKRRLPDDVEVRYVVGGLAPDTDQPMPDQKRQELQSSWRRIQSLMGTPFNFEFWTRCKPRRSTYPACRAVLAAEKQGKRDEMIFAIQRAYFLRALNPSDTETHLQLAAELGLDVEQFDKDLKSDEVQQELMRQIQLGLDLGHRGFPSLILEVNGKTQYFHHDYLDADYTLKKIEEIREALTQAA